MTNRKIIEKWDWYRYRSFACCNSEMAEEPEQILLGNQFYFPVAADMDDAAEGRPCAVQIDSNPSLATWIERARQFEQGTPEEIRVIAEEIYQRMEDPVRRRAALDETQRQMLRLYSHECPMCSFAPDPTCMRYWGQYGGKGKGYAIRMNFQVPWYLTLEIDQAPERVLPEQVNYSSSELKPKINITLEVPNSKENQEEVRAALFQKHQLWGDQKEGRIVRLGMQPGPVDFPPEFVDALYLGYDIKHRNRERLLDICRRRKTAIDVYECTASSTHYIIENTYVGRFGGPSA